MLYAWKLIAFFGAKCNEKYIILLYSRPNDVNYKTGHPQWAISDFQGTFLLTWINFNTSMDK